MYKINMNPIFMDLDLQDIRVDKTSYILNRPKRAFNFFVFYRSTIKPNLNVYLRCV